MTLRRTSRTAALLTAILLAASAPRAQLMGPQVITDQVGSAGGAAAEARRALPNRLETTAQAVQREADRLEALKAEAAMHEAALDPLTRALSNPLADLPDTLPILDAAGRVALLDVGVEGGWRAVAHEWLAWLPAVDQATLDRPGISVVSREPMDSLGLVLVRFRVAPALDNRAALEALLPAELHPYLDRNHIYESQLEEARPVAGSRDHNPGGGGSAACTRPMQLGMIDTAVQTAHPAFARTRILRKDFLPAELPVSVAHGTAVAGLLVGQGPALAALAPEATLHAASVFYARSDYSQGATTQSLVRALDWLVARQVTVINLSLVGPPNRLLALAVARASARQVALVAAVGNEGPAAPPLYPAAYPQVIGVTAVDGQQRIYRWANQGDQVDFAALGVGVRTARAISDSQATAFGRESGTSMAAPVVSARLACAMAAGHSLAEALAGLEAQAKDLGAPGRDPVFGVGLVH